MTTLKVEYPKDLLKLVGRELGERYVLDVRRLSRILLLGRQPGEHLLFVLAHNRGAERRRQWQRGDVVRGGTLENCGANVVDLAHTARP